MTAPAMPQTAASNPETRVTSKGGIYTREGFVRLGFGLEAWNGYSQVRGRPLHFGGWSPRGRGGSVLDLVEVWCLSYLPVVG
jgi:hypothetical protein